VVVPARNASATLPRTLACLARQNFDGLFEVVVVDNGSTDDTAEVAARALPAARVIRKEPGAVGSARNRGVVEATGERIAFVDSDCYPAPTWLAQGLACLEGADLVQGAVVPDPAVIMGPFDRTVSVGGESGLYETANLFVTRALFERVGGFEDWIVPDLDAPFGEDVWFGWVARRLGARTAFCEGAIVYHHVFRRGMARYVEERRRCEHFPALAARIPELRDAFFYRRWFLTSRSASFDLAAAAVGVAIMARSPFLLAGAAPYLRKALGSARSWRRRAPVVLVGEVLADAVTAASLLRGSAKWRTPVL
jgi:glycosyltransferase involved in cell wall biosynthesis